MRIGNGEFWLGDCLKLMSDIPDGSVDMVLCDLPYGATWNKWDSVIPFEPLWEHYWRVCKPNSMVVLTATQPFTSALVMSQPEKYRHDWSWSKTSPTGHLNAKRQPMRNHEDILVFGKPNGSYFPQGLTESNKVIKRGPKAMGNNYLNNPGAKKENVQTHTGYPRSRIEFSNDGKQHPTQKPVALFDYLIRTYTNPGDLVLDNCAGSGTTAVAAEQTGRRWLCIEREPSYYYSALGRIAAL